MFLENLLQEPLSASARRTVNLIISQLNLLLSQVNDVLDIKLIQEGLFEPKLALFSPLSVLEFIDAMFDQQAKM